jgi:hypothetical protein
MPKIVLTALACAAALVVPQLSSAQPADPAPAPVYESHDKAGPVFSDMPTPGATQVDLPPPNVIDSSVPAAPPPMPTPGAPLYQALEILSPANGSTIHSNTGSFKVTVRSWPPLSVGAQHRFKLKFDGQVLPHAYSSTTIQVTPADWSGAARSGPHTLQLAVVDAAGQVLMESTPVTFYAHRATVHHR